MLKIGIIGCGQIARLRHAPEYLNNPDCKLAGFFDKDIQKAQNMAEKYECRAYKTAEELLKADIDAVSVCTANVFHCQHTVAALKAGKHVLCEKPMAVTFGECQYMVRAASESGRLLAIAHNQRYCRSHRKARELLRSGVIGRLISFHLVFGHSGPENWTGQKNPWFFDRLQSGFGVLADLGTHKLDLLRYISGDEITEVTAVTSTVDKKYPNGTPIGVEDNAFLILRLRGGATGTVSASWTFYGCEDNSSVFYGTKGCMKIYCNPNYSIMIQKADSEEYDLHIDEMTTNKKQKENGFENTGVVDDFVRSIIENKPSASEGFDIMNTMKSVFAAEKSAKEHRTVFSDEL